MRKYKYCLIIILLFVFFNLNFPLQPHSNEGRKEYSPQINLIMQDEKEDDGTKINVDMIPLSDEIDLPFYLLEIYNPAQSSVTPIARFRIKNNMEKVSYSVLVKKNSDVVARVYKTDEKGTKLNLLAEKKVRTKSEWFYYSKSTAVIGVLIFLFFLIYFTNQSRKGKLFHVRKIPGLEAVDDAVGRATELGRPIYYVPGIGYASEIATLAALNILSPVTKRISQFGIKLKVPNLDPVVMSIAQDVVKEAYLSSGRVDLFDDNDVFFLTDQQFAFAGAVSGLFKREKPGTVFLLGKFYAESLIFAETANDIGAIQIAGTDETAQIPFFIAACDFTLIGEELFAASAYLSRDPLTVGTLKSQDYLKAILLIILILGLILNMFGIKVVT
ncbi:MAG: hypothetical protein FXF47_09195, partial [Candidatus Mcinerneyibacterium aminivorans]